MNDDHQLDDRSTLAALAAVEGRGSIDVPAELFDDPLVDEFERAAGLVFRALSADRHGGPEPPVDLAARLFASTSPRSAVAEPSFLEPPLHTPAPAEPRAVSSAVGALAWVGWAAAAALALAFAMRPASEGAKGVATIEVAALDASAAASDFETRADVTSAPWSVGDLEGDVLWSDAENTGFMRIRGLPANDPTRSQYQLWIFRGQDPAAEPHPIDGGVFDVPEGGVAVVPIDAKLNVGHAGLFAVTVESPGGVVVSEREQIVAVAVRGS